MGGEPGSGPVTAAVLRIAPMKGTAERSRAFWARGQFTMAVRLVGGATVIDDMGPM